jgi:raffinose/stachyose/melibiose transport system permease protein
MGLFRYTKKTFARELALLIVAAIWWIPFYFLVVGALKPNEEVFTKGVGALPSHIEWSNFSTAWHGTGGFGLGGSFKSSLIITIGTVLVLVIVGSISAYALARHPGKLGTGLYLVFAIGIIVPFQLGIVPTYVVMNHLGISSSYVGMILLQSGLLMPLSVFLYTGFVRTLPRDYEEAAYVDGAGRLRTFFFVVFPLLLPITGTVAVLTGVIVWNDFFLQLIFLAGSAKQTIPVAIYSFVGEYTTNWSLVFATVLLSIIPILVFYLFAQRQLIRGFSGGIKT